MEPIIIIKLETPINFGSEKITELRLRKPIAKDFRDMPLEPNVGDLLDVTAKLSGQAPSVIDQLDSIDLTEVLTVVGKFMRRGQPTGEATSDS